MSVLSAVIRPVSRRKLAVSAAGALCAAAAVAGPASGATSSSVTATVPVVPQIKSVTVSPSSITFGNCSPGGTGTALTFPNGTCVAPAITVANNGTIPEAIAVQGSQATPSDNGTAWSLENTTTSPGQDQYALQLQGSAIQLLSTGVLNDKNIGSNGTGVLPNASASEAPLIYGPSASTDQSTTFTSAITWYAL